MPADNPRKYALEVDQIAQDTSTEAPKIEIYFGQKFAVEIVSVLNPE